MTMMIMTMPHDPNLAGQWFNDDAMTMESWLSWWWWWWRCLRDPEPQVVFGQRLLVRKVVEERIVVGEAHVLDAQRLHTVRLVPLTLTHNRPVARRKRPDDGEFFTRDDLEWEKEKDRHNQTVTYTHREGNLLSEPQTDCDIKSETYFRACPTESENG